MNFCARMLPGLLPAAILVSLSSACTADPTELTRTIHVKNGLASTARIQLCSNRACTAFSSDDSVSPGSRVDEIVQDKAMNPARVTFRDHGAKTVRCVAFGPRIDEGMVVTITIELLKPCGSA